MEIVPLARHLAQLDAVDRAVAIWYAAAHTVGAAVNGDETVFQSPEQQAAFLAEVDRLVEASA